MLMSDTIKRNDQLIVRFYSNLCIDLLSELGPNILVHSIIRSKNRATRNQLSMAKSALEVTISNDRLKLMFKKRY